MWDMEGRALEVEGQERPELMNAVYGKKTLDIPREGKVMNKETWRPKFTRFEDFAKLELNPLKAGFLIGTSRYLPTSC